MEAIIHSLNAKSESRNYDLLKKQQEENDDIVYNKRYLSATSFWPLHS